MAPAGLLPFFRPARADSPPVPVSSCAFLPAAIGNFFMRRGGTVMNLFDGDIKCTSLASDRPAVGPFEYEL